MAKAKENDTKTNKEDVKTVDSVETKSSTKEPAEAPKATENDGLAKAGKRSAKAVAESEKKQEKEIRKAESTKEEAEKPKKVVKPTRSRAERRSKKYRKSAELIDANKEYKLKEALDLACKTSTTKFDGSIEMHVRLNVDPRQADQNIRDSVILPEGTGKTLRVAVFAEEDMAKNAIKAGADLAGQEEITNALDKGTIDFDVLISPPNLMVKLAKYARVLGPKGLMPNPKSGTVTSDIEKAVKQAKAGRIEYRVDTTGIIHVSVGKVSFGADKLINNANAVIASIKQNKPASLKGSYVRSISVTSTMGPGIKVPNSELT